MGDKQQHQQAGRFTRADLHIHTPESICYGDPLATPLQIVQRAVVAGLGAIAITDHNTFAGVDEIRRLGNQEGLTVFPGVEVSTEAGHVLALFDPSTPSAQLDVFLLSLGLDGAAMGDGARLVEGDIEDVFRKIGEHGGIAIAAHIDRWPTGFLEAAESRLAAMRIHGSSYLKALEITQPQNKSTWNEGNMRGFPKRYACIQNSDAHALADIGRRTTYLKLASRDLDGLRLALNDYEENIRFPEEMTD